MFNHIVLKISQNILILKIAAFLFCAGFLFFGMAGHASAATVFNDTTADHKWSTAGNWSDGKPDSADAVTVGAGVTSLNIDEAASALSFVPTGTAGITISGSGALSVYGDFTLDANVTWTHTGTIYITTNASTITTAGKSLGTIASFQIMGGAHGTLGGAINTGTKGLYVYGASTEFSSGTNYQIDCGIFGDNSTAGAITLTLGSSIINCTNIVFGSATLTVTANTAVVNITISNTQNIYFGAKTWGGTVTIAIGNGGLGLIRDANTFGNLTIVFNPIESYNAFYPRANQTISGTLTLTGNTSASYYNVRGMVRNWPGEAQTQLTAATVSMTGSIDFQGIKGAGAGSWDLSSRASGNLGGNTGITFRTPTTYYVACESNFSRQDYNDVFSLADDGTPDGAGTFPLPQDTMVVNNNTFSGTGQAFIFHFGGRGGTLDASALTKANTVGSPRNLYGDLILTGSGVTFGAYSFSADARLKDESSDSLDINIPVTTSATAIEVASLGGTVRLVTGLITTSSFTLTRGTFDLNGQTLTTGTFSSSNSNTRTLQDSVGGGKIVLNGLTGTIFDTTTATNLSINNAPDIDIGDSNNTLTGNVTFVGSGKTFGDLKIAKHAGDFDAIITGANTFGMITLETPDETYQYSHLQFPAGVTTAVTGFVSNGTATYQNIATSSAAFTLSDTTGTNTLTYTTLAYSQATGGATFLAPTSSGNIDGGNNTGWVFDGDGPTNVGISSISADSTTQLTVTAQTATDASGLAASPYWFNETSSNSGASDSSDWQAGTTFTDTELSANTQYTYQVKAKDSLGNQSSYSTIASKYTLANTPASPTVAAASASSLNASINENSNPSATTFSIKVGLKYIQADGTLGDSAVYQTKTVWGTPVAITGLIANTQYAVSVNAKNGDGAATDYSATASNYTLAPTPTNLAGTAGQTTMSLSVDSFTNATSDSSGYYFSRSGANSGWITTNSWSDSGLSCGTSYTYTVQYKNGDGTETATASLAKLTNSCPGGGGMPPEWNNPPKAPVGGFGVSVNNGAESTLIPTVILNLKGGSDTAKMAISNFSDFRDAGQENYTSAKVWNLCWKNSILQTPLICPDGTYTVYVKYYTSWGTASNVVSDTIILKTSNQPPASSNNILIQYPNDSKVYLLKDGKKHWIKDEQTFNSLNYKWSDIIHIPASQIYPDGEVIQNQSGSNLPVLSSALSQPFNKNLKLGQTSADIKRLQIFLNSDPTTQIAKSGAGSPGKETNFFGYLTKAAVIKFQEKYAQDILAPWKLTKGTGFVNGTTKAKINQLLGF